MQTWNTLLSKPEHRRGRLPQALSAWRLKTPPYTAGVYFSQTAKDTLEDKMKRLMLDDVKVANFWDKNSADIPSEYLDYVFTKGDITLVKLYAQWEFNFPMMKSASRNPIIAPGMYPRKKPPPTQTSTMMICIRHPILIPSYYKTTLTKVNPLFLKINTHLIDFIELV